VADAGTAWQDRLDRRSHTEQAGCRLCGRKDP